MNPSNLEFTLLNLLKKKGYPHISVAIDGGIATLNGHVTSWDEVIHLGYLAAHVKGISGVVNNIIIPGESPEKAHSLSPQSSNPRSLPEREGLPLHVDVVIIGAGITGCFIARELSRYDLAVVVVEKESDVACGATKANNAQVHNGMGEKSGTLKKKLCVQSWPRYERITEELDVPYRKTGLLVVITRDTLPRKIPSWLSHPILQYILPHFIVREGKKVGDTPRIINRSELVEMEPHITPRALRAVFMPNYAVVCPYKLAIGLAENAIMNGVTFFLETEVIGITTEGDRVTAVVTDRGVITTRFIINAAGVYADTVAGFAGAQEFTIHPRKGSILLFDKKMEGYISHQVSELRLPQTVHTKGGGVLLSPDGNLTWGPSAVEVPDKEDTSVTREEIEEMIEKYQPLFPDFPRSSVITYFAGTRAATYSEDFVISASSKMKGLIHAAGIQSPGLTAAPAIADSIISLLQEEGLPLKEKRDFNPLRKSPPRFSTLSLSGKKELIEKDSRYGNVVCRCEHVTEGEIVDAIHSPLPAVTVDAVKRRTRAGMGRCQGGFCGSRVATILARELHIPLEDVTKKGAGSQLFICEINRRVEM
ncbi:MAG: FAD/NAD(P)-binding oxidoreductase [Theionarchaea archaeon]|nr:FAD/NAD(P)-binding oxidoreductase [Theionarchaea archaeon]